MNIILHGLIMEWKHFCKAYKGTGCQNLRIQSLIQSTTAIFFGENKRLFFYDFNRGVINAIIGYVSGLRLFFYQLFALTT